MSTLGVETVAELTAPGWDGPPPALSALVPTYNRSGFLPDLIRALEAQDLPREEFEVVVIDNGSTDDTWAALSGLAAAASLRLRVARIEPNRGPAVARNTAAALSRGGVLAFTDDDCLPTALWLPAIARVMREGADVVQGRTLPEPGGSRSAGPWDRSMWITAETPLFETCNLAFRRTAFVEAGGFAAAWREPGGEARPFGEDVELGWRLLGDGARRTFAAGALVYHRVLPGTWPQWLREQRRLALFPGLARRVPAIRRHLRLGLFLSDRTALFDLAVAGAGVALALRRPWLLAATLPWLRQRWRETGHKPGRPRPVRLAQLAVGDAVGLVSLLEGSARQRRLIL